MAVPVLLLVLRKNTENWKTDFGWSAQFYNQSYHRATDLIIITTIRI